MRKPNNSQRRWVHPAKFLAVLLSCSILIENAGLSWITPQPAQASPAGQTAGQPIITGEFYSILGGPRPYYYLYDDNGQNNELIIDERVLEEAGGATSLNRRRVRLTGTRLGISRTLNGEPAVQVTSLQREIVRGKPDAINEVIIGSRPFVNILCRFSDSTGTTPRPVSYFTGLMSNTKPGLDDYFRQASFGAIDLQGTQVVGWYDLPQPLSYYFTSDPPNFQRLASDCTAKADPFINFNAFQGINLMFNQNFGCCAWGGSQFLTLDGTSKSWPMTWMPRSGYQVQSILAHEMGHAFGMPHSANVLGTTYTNSWDVMSKDRYNCAAATDPVYGCVGQQQIAYHKDIPGWIPANRSFVAPVGGGSTTIELQKLNQPGSTGYLMAKIPIGGSTSQFFTVEGRYRDGYDIKLAGDAVIIHRVDTTRLNPAWIVDADGNAETADAGAQWLPGETFSDTATGISVEVVSATAGGFVVTITTPVPPALTLNAPATAVNLNLARTSNWFQFTAPVKSLYTLQTNDTGTLHDTYLTLYGPGGVTTAVAQDDNSGGGGMARINRILLNPGTYYVAVRSNPTNLTGTYSIQASAPLLVTDKQNTGELGSLSYAVAQSQPNDTVFLLPAGGNTISSSQPILIDKNITLQGQCGDNGPVITLDGSEATANLPGLILSNGARVNGLRVSGFPGPQIQAGPGSYLSCVAANARILAPG